MPRSLSLLAVLLMASTASAADFTVDVARPLKPVDHAASGALYGIAGPGWPPQDWIDRIHPENFTQMAPGGHQLPNGETAPVGDALQVAPMAAAAGATVTIRMPDTFPSFPYVWSGSEFWAGEVNRIVTATVAAHPPNIYAYEIWNEPDWNWQPQWGDFNAVWASTYAAIRKRDPSRRIMGPSASRFDAAWMRSFLATAIAAKAIPDIVSWHELDPRDADAIEAHVASFRALEQELGLPPHPISINEYGSQRAMADPGALVHYIAQLERAGVDSADLAFWHRPGRLSDLLVPKAAGTGPATDPVPTGAYWLYGWYGAMEGSMVAATAAPGIRLDGFAAYRAPFVDIVVGGEAGSHTIHVSGLADFGPTAHVEVTLTHWTGTDGAEPSPEPVYSGDFTAAGGNVSLPVVLQLDSDAAHIEISPIPIGPLAAASVITYANPPDPQRIEAESGKVTGGRTFPIRMAPGNFGANRASGDAYVGFFNRPGAALALPVTVRDAGKYRLTIGYSNGQNTPIALTLSIGGQPAGTLSLPPTQGRELFGTIETTATLPAGTASLSLTFSGPPLRVPVGPSVLEFDRIDVTRPLPG